MSSQSTTACCSLCIGVAHGLNSSRCRELAAGFDLMGTPTTLVIGANFSNNDSFGMVINTLFDLLGRTIVNTPTDALDDFLDSQWTC